MNPESHMPMNPSFPVLRWSTSAATRGLAGVALLLATAAIAPASRAATPSELLAGYAAQAGSLPLPARGQQIFTAPRGREWSCSSCHGAQPTQAGKHASTGKAIGPLAPAFNVERFTDAARTEKWFRRNCNDVMGRECTAGEKADVMSWLLTLKP
jgi:mono/diheme cytochrome c family protein